MRLLSVCILILVCFAVKTTAVATRDACVGEDVLDTGSTVTLTVTPVGATAAILADFNLDGYLDSLVAHHDTDSTVAWQANDGSGAFSASYTSIVNAGDLPGEVTGMCVGDVNNDGSVDVFVLGVGFFKSYEDTAGDGSTFTARYDYRCICMFVHWYTFTRWYMGHGPVYISLIMHHHHILLLLTSFIIRWIYIPMYDIHAYVFICACISSNHLIFSLVITTATTSITTTTITTTIYIYNRHVYASSSIITITIARHPHLHA